MPTPYQNVVFRLARLGVKASDDMKTARDEGNEFSASYNSGYLSGVHQALQIFKQEYEWVK